MKRLPHKPRRMYAPCAPHELDDRGGMMVSTTPEPGRNVPVLVIPLSKEAVAKLQLKVAKAQHKRFCDDPWTGISKHGYQSYMWDALCMLKTLGVRHE